MSSNLVNKEFEGRFMKPIINDDDEIIDKYVPRKCAATSKILGPKEHSAIQITVPDVDSDGRIIEGSNLYTFAISGYVREKGRSDLEIEKILRNKGLYPLPN